MTTAQLILSILYFVIALALIAIVMLQSGKSAGLSGTIAGGADTFLSKNKAKSADARMAKMTKWVAILFLVLTLVISFVS
ncbi:MAG TPA: preprotein translocase subunit SecG [Candidatus Enterenecus stercoripullorum]|nr:preprotein translocase subunit SecG [Candidatus Enterenecus stercoripullorum]